MPPRPDPDLVQRIASSTGLPVTDAARVVEDVIAYYSEPVAAYVRRRHAHLQLHGARNNEIFALISQELHDRVVAAPEFTERQLRRLVYG